MKRKYFGNWLLYSVVLTSGMLCAQSRPSPDTIGQLHLRISSPQSAKHHGVPAVVWLEPIERTPALPFLPRGHYTLLQRNRTFIPHLQVIPVGAVVQFPNTDPFFHNVFSLFDGKRFDLGLYEAGSSKSVTFTREGVSYIFCNIHPEMSAVVLSLSTPLYAIANTDDSFVLRNIPTGDYLLHLWVEGVPQPVLESLGRPVHVSTGSADLGTLNIPSMPSGIVAHTNKFGKAYDRTSKSPYER